MVKKGFKVVKKSLRGTHKGMKAVDLLVPTKKITFTEKVSKVINRRSELKHYTVTGVGNATGGYANDFALSSGTQAQTLCTDMAQGNTDITRNGDKIEITSLHYRIFVRPSTDASVVSWQAVRIIAVQYKPNALQLAFNITRLLVNDYTGNPGSLSHQNIDHQQDYHILMDKTFQMAQNASAAGAYTSKGGFFLSGYVPLGNAKKDLQYDAGGLGHNNGIYIVAVSTAGNVAADALYNIQTRLRFLDS